MRRTVKADLRPRAAFAQPIEQSLNVEVTGAARLHRAVSVWTAGLGNGGSFEGTKQLQCGFTEPSVARNADSALMRGTSKFFNERGGIVDDASNFIPSDFEGTKYGLV